MAVILNIDTSLETATVSIGKDGIIVQLEINAIQNQHAAFLHSAVQKLTNDLQITLHDLDAIGCTIGPGSYTGLRVGLAAAKGFCFALNKPLITIGTLKAMAHSVQITENKKDFFYCPMIDARRMEVYTALYDNNLTEIKPAHAEIIDTKFCSAELQNNKILFFGNGADKFQKIAKNEQIIFHNCGNISTSVCTLSFDDFKNSRYAELSASTPLYAKEFYNGV